jgi:Spy/CpxP family protein refolding chaperone
LQQLDLSDEQKTQIQNIRKEGGSREEVRAVLTPEQQAKLDTAHEKNKGAGAHAQ